MMCRRGNIRVSSRIAVAIWGTVTVILVACGKDSAPPPFQPQSSQGAFLTISDGPIYDFGATQVGSSKEKEFIVSNIGILPATTMSSGFYLSINFKYKDGLYPGTSGTCGHTLAKNASCKVIVVFEPQYAGNFEDSIKVDYHDGNQNRSTQDPIIKGSSFN